MAKDSPDKKSGAEDYAEIARSIGRMSDAARAMSAAGLSREATVVLLKHATGVPMSVIRKVISAAEELRDWCLTKQ